MLCCCAVWVVKLVAGDLENSDMFANTLKQAEKLSAASKGGIFAAMQGAPVSLARYIVVADDTRSYTRQYDCQLSWLALVIQLLLRLDGRDERRAVA